MIRRGQIIDDIIRAVHGIAWLCAAIGAWLYIANEFGLTGYMLDFTG